MTETVGSAASKDSIVKLPRRDWFLLPAIALLTIAVVCLSTESLARWLYPTSESGLENCYATDDPSGNAPVKPYAVCTERVAESRYRVEYRYDSRGHRSDVELGPKDPNTFRIVMMGSSLAMGLFVPREMTFAALLPKELSSRTGKKIELYNEATGGKFRGGPFPLPGSQGRFQDVLSAKPDMILWIITPMDIENASGQSAPVEASAADDSVAGQGSYARFLQWNVLESAIRDGELVRKLTGHWDKTRASIMLKHTLLTSQSQEQYVDSYLKNDYDAGFLRKSPRGEWVQLLQDFKVDAEGFEDQAKAAGVPFVAVLVPNRAQAAMISMGQWPASYDPYELGNQVRRIVESHGGTYLDILPDFRTVPDPEQNYLPVDGHPDATGHAMIAGMLARKLAPDLKHNVVLASQAVPSESGRGSRP